MSRIKWHKTTHPGIRYREHPSRKHGKKLDRYYALHYKLDGRVHDAGLGWVSQGMTEQQAVLELATLKQNHLKGEGPTTIKEKKEENRLKKVKEERDTMTFSSFFEDHYLPYNRQNKPDHTYQNEKRLYEKWIKPSLGDKLLQKVAPLDLERVKKDALDKGKSPRTLQYILAVIRHSFNVAKVMALYEGDNPVSRVKKPTFDNRRVRFLTYEEADTLLKALTAKSQQVHDIALLSLHTGMRAGEIFTLKWGDVDLQREIIHIKDTKTSRNRVARMTSHVNDMFKGYTAGDPMELVFKDQSGKQIKEISRSFDRVVDELKLNEGVNDRRNRVVFHTLRHTFASWLVENGESLYTVKELMGHSTLAMTERYSHLGESSMQNAVKKFDEMVKARSEEISKTEEMKAAKR